MQLVAPGERCRHTGLLLTDIWRYFRHTWTNYYATTPGRTMQLLVRDRAATFHPVIGIAALVSAIVQIRRARRLDRLAARAVPGQPSRRPHRDDGPLGRRAAGTRPVANCTLTTSCKTACTGRPCGTRHPRRRSSGWSRRPSPAARPPPVRTPVRLQEQVREGRRPRPGGSAPRSDLFRSKRCLALADLLRARAALSRSCRPGQLPTGCGRPSPTRRAGAPSPGYSGGRRRESVGTEIADLAVCGAVAPYNAILGGKLVSMLAVGPAAVRAYRDKYSGYESEIASAMAGRAIQRRANLVFIGTTSLYGSGSSQYNRIRIPADVLGGTDDIRFRAAWPLQVLRHLAPVR